MHLPAPKAVEEASIQDRRADKIEKLAVSLWHLGGLWNPWGAGTWRGHRAIGKSQVQGAGGQSLEAAPGERQRAHSRQSQGAGGRGKAQGAQRVGAPKP